MDLSNMPQELPQNEPVRPLKVLVMLICAGDVKPQCAVSVARAAAYFAKMPYGGEKSISIDFISGTMPAEMRTRTVAHALQVEATHILWVDPDMDIPEDTIPALLNHNLPVVALSYPQATIYARPVARIETDDTIGPLMIDDDSRGLREVKTVGMGCMLTDVRVFEALEPPLFCQEPQPPTFVRDIAEHTYFCRKLRKAGLRIFVDAGLSRHVKRIGDYEYMNYMAKIAAEVHQKEYDALPTE